MTIVNKKEMVEKETYSHCICDNCKEEFARNKMFGDSLVTKLTYHGFSGGMKEEAYTQTLHFCSTVCLLSYMRTLHVGDVDVHLTSKDVETLATLGYAL